MKGSDSARSGSGTIRRERIKTLKISLDKVTYERSLLSHMTDNRKFLCR